MRKTLLHAALAVAALAAPALTSCLGNDDPKQPNTFTATLNANMNFTGVKTIQSGEWNSFAGGTLRYQYDFENTTLQLTVSSMAIAQGVNLTFQAPAIPLTADKDGAWVANHAGPFDVAGGGQSYTLTDIKTYLRLPAGAPSILLTEFTIDGKYLVRVFPIVNYFGGTTRVEFPQGQPFETDVTHYNVSLDQAKMTCDIFSNNTKFTSAMPSWLNLVYPSLPFKLTDEGISFEGTDIIPMLVTYNSQTGVEDQNSRKPMPDYKLATFSGTMEVAKALEFSCSRNGKGDTSFKGTPLVEVKSVN